MPRDSKFGSALITHVVRHGLGPFLESTRTLVALVDSDGRPLAGNPAFELVWQAGAADASFFELVDTAQRASAELLFETASQNKKTARGQLYFGTAGKSIQYEFLFAPAGRDATLLFAEPLHADIDLLSSSEQLAAELREARSSLAEKTAELHSVLAQADVRANTDSLTFLPNRRSIIAELQHQVIYAERYGTSLAVSMMDLDGFKSVNDSSGHPAGDKILGFVAHALRDRIRKPDEIGRYGGDEFLVILPNSTAAAASEQASRLCEHFRMTPIPAGASTIRLTLSAGVAQFIPGEDTWQSLLERADRALYEAKRLGGDQWLILES